MINTLVGQIFLVLVTIASASGGLYSTWVSRKQIASNTKRTDVESEHMEDQTWISRLDALSRDLKRLQGLSDERFERLIEIETLITEHVQWDFKMVRECRARGWHVEDPPSLVYVKRKIQEEKAVIQKEMGNNSDTIGSEE